MLQRQTNGQNVSMGSGIFLGMAKVMGLGNNLPLMGYDSPNGNLFAMKSLIGLAQGRSHKVGF